MEYLEILDSMFWYFFLSEVNFQLPGDDTLNLLHYPLVFRFPPLVLLSNLYVL